MTTIDDLKFDPQNARKRTERSANLLEQSIEELGFARSIVIDEHGVILAGNGTVAAARELDMTNIQIVDTDGDTLIAVRRHGLTESQKKRLALLDNRTAELAEWDTAVLADLLDADPSMNDGMFDDAELAVLFATDDMHIDVDDPKPDEPIARCCPACGQQIKD